MARINYPAEHKVGDVLYFIPSESRMHPAHLRSGEVMIAKVIDHGEEAVPASRFGYVVQVEGVSVETQEANASELFAIGAVPVDMRFWETYSTSICSDCKEPVACANTKIVSEPIIGAGKFYPGMCTTKERRVCIAC